jgi:hypothetical protein
MKPVPRHTTLLLAHVSGTSRLAGRMGESEAAYAIERCVARMERVIAGCHGRVLKAAGSDLLAAFDDVEAAGHAALDIRQRVAALPPVSGLKLSVRIGLHAGPDDGAMGESAETARRVASLARADQILVSSVLADQLPGHSTLHLHARADLGLVEERESSFGLSEIDWEDDQPLRRSAGKGSEAGARPVARLRVHYRGATFVLDEEVALLTLGRDPSCDLRIVDRKASRHHGLIENRRGRFFYIDDSTNGSYVSTGRAQDAALRRREAELKGSGRIYFGATRKDPEADFAEFERI